MIRGVGGDRVERAGAREVGEVGEEVAVAVAAFVAAGDGVERGVIARAPARSWAPRARLDEATAGELREQIAIGMARLIVG